MATAPQTATKRARRVDELDSRWRRRAVTIPAIVAATFAAFVLSPLVIPAAVVLDVLRLRRRFPAVRCWLFLLQYLATDALEIVAAPVLWAMAGFGQTLDDPRSMRRYRRLQEWSVGVLGDRAEQLLGLSLPDVESLRSTLAPGPVIVLARHVAMLDASIPLIVYQRLGLHTRVVMMAELLNDPGFDLIYRNAGSRFVVRENDPSSTSQAADVARALDDRTAAVIFPEGRLARPPILARSLARIEERDPERAQRLRSLRHLLPPRPGGVLALLDAAPEADVVVIAHAGLDRSARLIDLISNAPIDPLAIDVQRIPRGEIPTDPAARLVWLDDLWLAMDRWVHDHVGES